MSKKLTFGFLNGKISGEKMRSTVHNTKSIKDRKKMDQQIFNQSSVTPPASETIIPVTPIIYAGFWRRFIAVLIDAFFTGIIGALVGFITGNDMIVSISVSTVIGIIYIAVFDSSELMGTPGKAMLGLSVVTEKEQNRISFQTAILRFLCKYISSVVLLIGYMIQPFTEKRQTFHDIVTSTIVIRKDPGQLNYWNCFKDNFNKIINN